MMYELILSDAAILCGVSVDEVQSKTQRIEIVRARQLAWYILHKKYGWSYNTIARCTKRDHTTIIHGINKINDLMLMHSDVRHIVDELYQINYAEIIRTGKGPNL